MKIDMSNREDFDYKEYFKFLSEEVNGRIDPNAFSYFEDYRSYGPGRDHSIHDAKISQIDANHASKELKITYLSDYGKLFSMSYDCADQSPSDLNFSPFEDYDGDTIVFHRLVIDDGNLRHELLFVNDKLTTIYFKDVKVEFLT